MPFLLPNGLLGLHFMNLGTSIETEYSLLSEVEEVADEINNWTGPISADAQTTYIDALTCWQSNLQACLDLTTTALQKVQSHEVELASDGAHTIN
jgi:hypothetical protein